MCFWSLRTIFGPTWTPTCQLPRLGGAPHIIKYQYQISNIEYQISSLPTPSFRWTSKYHPTIVKNWEVTFTFAQQKQINIKIKTIDSSPEIHTPNLDELAATSAVFNRAYVQVVHRSLCTYKQASTEAYMPMCRQVQKYKHTSSISIRSTYSVVNESYWFFKLSKHAGWDSLVLDRIKRKWKYVFAKDI